MQHLSRTVLLLSTTALFLVGCGNGSASDTVSRGTETTGGATASLREAAMAIELSAGMIDRQLRAMAAQGDGNPRRAELFMQMAAAGDLSENVTVRLKGTDGAPIDVWDGKNQTALMEDVVWDVSQYEVSGYGYSVCVQISEAANSPSEIGASTAGAQACAAW